MTYDDVLIDYLPIGVLIVVAVIIAIALPVISVSLGPKRPEKLRLDPYESGIVAVGEAQRRLPIKFYRIAVLFILFDVDIILLVPWAVSFRQLGIYGLVAMLIFMVFFILGDAWVWKKGLLEWD
jgi:NADH-quinone oxidoreductase subunit A